MSSFIPITLDTKSPTIQIFMADNTTNQATTFVTVQADETLENYQDFYLIDSAGTRHDVPMVYNGDHFSANIVFPTASLGTATFYAQVKDEVWNISEQISKDIEIFEANVLFVIVNDRELHKIKLTNKKQFELLTGDKVKTTLTTWTEGSK